MAQILLVDDDTAQLRTWARSLRPLGHELTLATGQSEVVALLDRPDTAFHAALVDLRLLDGSGQCVIQKLRAHQPRLAIAVVSGYLDGDTAVELWRDNVVAVPKPVHELGALVERLLATGHDTLDAQIARFADHLGLSAQQARLLGACLRGQSGKECAEFIGCTDGTTRRYLQRIFARLGCTTQRQLAAAFVAFVETLHAVPPPPPTGGPMSGGAS